MPVIIFRTLAFAITVAGVVLLVATLLLWLQGGMAAKYFPGIEPASHHHLTGLLLALPVPLHVIFIGLIIQKRHLPLGWQRIALFGITASGLWLGASLALRACYL